MRAHIDGEMIVDELEKHEFVRKGRFDPEIGWLRDLARYFEARNTYGEDIGHWANVFNAENANNLADRLASLSKTEEVK